MNVTESFESIEFQVKYSLADYYAIIADHVPIAVQENPKKSSAFSAWLVCRIVPTISCAVAILNGKLRRTYTFTISAKAIKRTADKKELLVTWEEVKKVRQYRSSFFIELKKGGALPLPYRALSDDHRSKLDRLFFPK